MSVATAVVWYRKLVVVATEDYIFPSLRVWGGNYTPNPDIMKFEKGEISANVGR